MPEPTKNEPAANEPAANEPATNEPATNEAAQPSAEVQALDRLVGTWKVTGGAEGTVRYEWMPGRHFLLQHVDLTQSGEPVRGMEVIGKLRPFGEPTGEEVVSRYYDSLGNTFDYVYELTGDELTGDELTGDGLTGGKLTIWGGVRGGPAYFEGTFSADGATITGEWVYPGGGGYQSTMTRL